MHTTASARIFHGLGLTLWLWSLVLLLLVPQPMAAHAMEVHPSEASIQRALERGRGAARERTPPNRLYAWFGSEQAFEPRGFLVTKVTALAAMSAHFALRSDTPTDEAIDRILHDPFLMVTVIMFGSHEQFAVDTYLVLQQGDRMIKPDRVRFDGVAQRTDHWPAQPAYRAKAVGFFAYEQLEPTAPTRLSVFPGSGGELTFQLDFEQIE